MVSNSNKSDYEAQIQVVNHEKLLFLVFSLIQKLVDDERPEVFFIDHHLMWFYIYLESWCPIKLIFFIAIKFSRSGIQQSGHFFRYWEVMGTNFQKACGRIVYGTISSRCWMAPLIRCGKWFNRFVLEDSSDRWIFFCRLQHHQRTNGKGKKLVLEEGKQCTCLYIIGDKRNSLCVDVFWIVHHFLIVLYAWITHLFQKTFTSFPTIKPCHPFSDLQSQYSPEAVGWNICPCPWRNSPPLPVLFSSSWKPT